MKTENFNFRAQYQAPGMKMVKLCPRGHFLQQVSPYDPNTGLMSWPNGVDEGNDDSTDWGY